MYSIVYVSTAQPDLKESVIKEIFELFRVTNDAQNIGGILIYSEGNFFQVLESQNADKQKIIDLYSRIFKDDRHYDVIKILEKETKDRCFSKYHCGFRTLFKSANIKELYNFLKQEKQYNPQGYSEIAYLAQKFLALI